MRRTRGRSDELQKLSELLLATRGVTHGGLEIVADEKHEHDHPHPHAPHRAKRR